MSFEEEEVTLPQKNTFHAQEESVQQRKKVSLFLYALGQNLNPSHGVYFFYFSIFFFGKHEAL